MKLLLLLVILLLPSIGHTGCLQSPSLFAQNQENNYAGTSNTKKLHQLSCHFAQKINSKNIIKFETRNSVLNVVSFHAWSVNQKWNYEAFPSFDIGSFSNS